MATLKRNFISWEFCQQQQNCLWCTRNSAQLELGLVAAEGEAEQDSMLASLKVVWNEREQLYNSLPQFHSWFWYTACQQTVVENMLWLVRPLFLIPCCSLLLSHLGQLCLLFINAFYPFKCNVARWPMLPFTFSMQYDDPYCSLHLKVFVPLYLEVLA